MLQVLSVCLLLENLPSILLHKFLDYICSYIGEEQVDKKLVIFEPISKVSQCVFNIRMKPSSKSKPYLPYLEHFQHKYFGYLGLNALSFNFGYSCEVLGIFLALYRDTDQRKYFSTQEITHIQLYNSKIMSNF